MDSAKRVISGTWGECWLDGDYVSEISGLQMKVNFNKTEINQAGKMATDTKITSYKGTGSLSMHKVNSRMAIKIGNEIKNGRDPRFTVISKLADPDAYGAERVVVNNVSFDDLTLADWRVAQNGTVEAPFTFTDYDFLDWIEVR
jgi:hypothetical protein